MRYRNAWQCCLLAGVFLASVCGSATVTTATTFTWTQPNGCGILSCDFFNPNFWSPAGGPPGTGDRATISMSGNIHLSQSTEVLDNLTLETSTQMRTFGNRLNVSNSPGNFFLFGSGFLGSTYLRVDPGGGFEVTARTISLHQGSELFLAGGGVTVTFRLLVSSSSLVSGNGVIGLVGNQIGSALELTGKLRPSGGDMTIISPNSFLDLDGNLVGTEPGFVDVTSSGNLILNGEHFDPFSGRFDIGNNRSVTFDSPFSVDGELNVTSAISNRLVGPMFSFLSGAMLSNNQSALRIEGESRWEDGAGVSLTTATARLLLDGDSTIEEGASFTGDGLLTNSSGFEMSLRDGAQIGVGLRNDGTLLVGESPGIASLGNFTQGSNGSLSIELGGVMPGEFDALAISGDAQFAGVLNVDLLSPFSLGAGQSFEIIDVAGTRTGTFAGLGENALVGNFGGTDLFISYAGGDGNDVVLFTDGTPGDFDNDGDVDGRDFLVWQRNPSVGNLADWQANYGASLTAAATAVPEPGTLVTLLAILGMGLFKKRGTYHGTFSRLPCALFRF